jgi:hypothetical protein
MAAAATFTSCFDAEDGDEVAEAAEPKMPLKKLRGGAAGEDTLVGSPCDSSSYLMSEPPMLSSSELRCKSRSSSVTAHVENTHDDALFATTAPHM